MKAKSAVPDLDLDPGPFLRLYAAAKAAKVDTQAIDKVIGKVLREQHGLTYQQARMWWGHHLIKAGASQD